MTRYYARNGEEITMEQWGKLQSDMDYKRVGIHTFPGGRWVSTVWLGLDHQYGDRPILIFETMVFDGKDMMDEYVERYTTEEEAQEGHERIVNTVRELEEVDGRAGHTHQAPGSTGSDGQEDQDADRS